MKPLFHIVGGLDLSAERDPKKSLAQARRFARPFLKRWLQQVEQQVLAGRLIPLDLMMAKELTNYPSANEGRCYAGQTRLGAAVGSCQRTARSSLKRLSDAGLLTSKRGGPGRTAAWRFCVSGVPVFERQVADKPSEPNPIEHKLPPNPPAPDPLDEGGLIGEVLPPETEITFDEFWKSIRHNPGKAGPALAAWRKVSCDDRSAISSLIGPSGIDLDGMWAAVWLAQRRWEFAPLTSRPAFGDWIGEAPLHRIIYLKPYSAEWMAERERKLAAGESVKFMDTCARGGLEWEVRPPPTPP